MMRRVGFGSFNLCQSQGSEGETVESESRTKDAECVPQPSDPSMSQETVTLMGVVPHMYI